MFRASVTALLSLWCATSRPLAGRPLIRRSMAKSSSMRRTASDEKKSDIRQSWSDERAARGSPMIIYRCPECGGDKLAVRTKVWVHFPEHIVEPDDVDDAAPVVGDDALSDSATPSPIPPLDPNPPGAIPAGFCIGYRKILSRVLWCEKACSGYPSTPDRVFACQRPGADRVRRSRWGRARLECSPEEQRSAP
jgi:hypothetical protein